MLGGLTRLTDRGQRMTSNRRTGPGIAAPQTRRDAACALAVDALGYLAGDPELLSGFLALTGLDPATIRDAAEAPEFLVGVLDYVAGDERLLIAFAAHAEIDPEEIEIAKQVLSSADWERDLP
jgi:hypothetical protein